METRIRKTICLPEKIADAAIRQAWRERRSLSNLIAIALETYIKGQQSDAIVALIDGEDEP